MRNIYWGAYNAGKFHMKMIHRASCMEQLRFNESGHSCNVLQYDGEVENELLYYKDEKGEIKMRKKRKSLTAIHRLDYEYGECYNYVDDRPVKHRDTIKEVDVMPYAQHKEDKHFTFLPSFNKKLFDDNDWVHLIEEWDTVKMAMTPYPFIGIPTQRECINGKRIVPHGDALKFLGESRNFVPYKENVLDSMISKLACFDKKLAGKRAFKITGRPTVFKDLFDAYKKHKDLVWLHLDDIVNEGRNIEYRLRELNIPYEYFNLDKDDYAVFGCTAELPHEYTHPDWDLTNEKTYNNWSKLKRMAEEYISVRQLKDVRLDATIKP